MYELPLVAAGLEPDQAQIYEILLKEKFPAWKMIDAQNGDRKEFLEKRKKYLLY